MVFDNGFESDEDPLGTIAAATTAINSTPRVRSPPAILDLTRSPVTTAIKLDSVLSDNGEQSLKGSTGTGAAGNQQSTTSSFVPHPVQPSAPLQTQALTSQSHTSSVAAPPSPAAHSAAPSDARYIPPHAANQPSAQSVSNASVRKPGTVSLAMAQQMLRVARDQETRGQDPNSGSRAARGGASTQAGIPPPNARGSPVVSHAVQGSSSKGKGKASQVVDLTADDEDEDEVMIVAKAEEKVVIDETPVCLGVLTSLALILHVAVELLPPSATASVAVVQQPSMPVHIYRTNNGSKETLKLMTHGTNDYFGVVENKIASVLGPLLGDGYSGTSITPRNGAILACQAAVVRRGERNPTMLPLTLLLFCRPQNIAQVSDLLASHHHYLEHPASYNPAHYRGYRYQNPHNPPPGGRGEAERRRVAHNNGLGAGGSYSAKLLKTVDVQRKQVEDVFDNLKSGVDLDECEPHPMVTTQLYPHQKQALSFLLDREAGSDALELPVASGPGGRAINKSSEDVIHGLWRQRRDVYGRTIGWQNLVSQVEISGEAPPPQTRGAILADDMGECWFIPAAAIFFRLM